MIRIFCSNLTKERKQDLLCIIKSGDDMLPLRQTMLILSDFLSCQKIISDGIKNRFNHFKVMIDFMKAIKT